MAFHDVASNICLALDGVSAGGGRGAQAAGEAARGGDPQASRCRVTRFSGDEEEAIV
jgi:hypothetical protein